MAYRAVEPGIEPVGEGRPDELARIRARSKARGARVEGPPGWVLGVDTVVEIDQRELGQPRDAADARGMLSDLSGREHLVHSAICLLSHPAGELREETACSRVMFANLSCEDIDVYLASGQWEGKAGAYGIQDDACGFARLIEGELDTVIGLPIRVLRRLLGEDVMS